MDDNITKFKITWNNGKGVMTLNLEIFFSRSENKSKKFIHTTKPDIYKVFKLVNEWCSESDILFLLNWLAKNECEDLVQYYLAHYKWIKESYDKQKIR